jgi:hypothetical protein
MLIAPAAWGPVQWSTAVNPVAVIVPSCAAATYSRLTEWVWLLYFELRAQRWAPSLLFRHTRLLPKRVFHDNCLWPGRP